MPVKQQSSDSPGLGSTRLHYLCSMGEVTLARLMLIRCPPLERVDLVNQQNDDGETALHWTMKGGRRYIGLASTLLRSGADPTITDKNGHNAAYYALLRGVEFLKYTAR